jgi:hypothetical protein
MKKLVLTILMVLTIALSACNTSTIGTAVGSTSNELPIEDQLAVGTLRLAETEQDITGEQAQELVLLWQTYREISQSETAAQAEIDGLIAQIRETMTDEQIQAIEEMRISQQDVLASVQGITVASSSSDDNIVTAPTGGDMPSGAAPLGNGVPPDGAMPDDFGGTAPSAGTDQSSSAQAGSGFGSTASVPSALVEAVIQSLQQKIAA